MNNIKDFAEQVPEVNCSSVDAPDVLSDTVYLYNSISGCVEMCD